MPRLTLTRFALAAALSVLPALAVGQTAPAPAPVPAAGDWRTVAPENLLVIDTSKGRVLVEIEPLAAPNHVERVRTLADQGFYDGLTFHRVLTGFMAQTGDPLGTGAGGSELPDIAGEFSFRRGRDAGFAPVPNGGEGLVGFVRSIPVVTQPDAQMMVTADFKTPATGLFCGGVVGMARAGSPDSANSQFFLMMARNDVLNGNYTVFGRVLSGLEVVTSLKAGPESADGKVAENPDTMTRVRTAAATPAAERPSVRVLDPRSAAFQAHVAEVRADKGMAFSVCDVMPVAEVVAP
ncbi:peptidylprolyl isomerase [Brevundimonas sp. LM2]|uniref:peptidylprolyl isomerase n=1 Tax=Brevundimonas sp. LM2 TaxID=1938605 RepID=UPI000983EC23|nr:peptidylprolyl isomerase [Brevundimonas sp. LM2]AQR62519.1 peptidylprolyl isomerase [Brevundimonas sp. LM2]